MNVQQTPLPGVGVRYDLRTFEGRRLAVTARPDGSVELAVYQDDRDAVAETVTLRAAERAALAQLLAAPRTPPDDEIAAPGD